MKKVLSLSFAVVLFALSYSLLAQKLKKKDDEKKPNKTVVVIGSSITAYLGQSMIHGGKISKQTFDSLLRQGVTAGDSIGNKFRVNGFTFSYGERTLYEDSVGNLMVLTDYLTEYCPGDTVSRGISLNIFQKTKPGDTAYFDNIKVTTGLGEKAARSMRFILTK